MHLNLDAAILAIFIGFCEKLNYDCKDLQRSQPGSIIRLSWSI